MKSPITLCLAWLLVLSSTSSGAVVVNGSFEGTPAFAGWDTIGLTSIESDYFGILPSDNANQALVRTGDGAQFGTGVPVAGVGGLAEFLNISEAGIQSVVISRDADNGSAIKQTITVDNPGDKLIFDWNFVNGEGTTDGFSKADTAFYTVGLAGDTPTAFFLAKPESGDQIFDGGQFRFKSGLSQSSHIFAAGGSYVIGFGVVNAGLGDTFGSSGLLLDNVRLTAVPEPTALAGLGLLALSLTIRRRRRNK